MALLVEMVYLMLVNIIALYDLPEAFNDHNEINTFDKANCSDATRDSYDADSDPCS